MKRLVVLTLLVMLAACGTPQEQCISAATRDMRVVDRLIRETEGNRERGSGYEYITVLETDIVPCGTTENPGKTCLVRRPEQERREVAIDLAAEQRKLDQLKAKRATLARAVAPVVEQCRIDNPE
ncbi:MAG: hypothetical protein ACRC14_02515 [Paracoccaceae bacterium]